MTTSNDGVPTTIADVTTTTATASKAEEEPERMLLPPYIWDACQPPSEDTLQLWVEVGNKLDKESTGKLYMCGRGVVIRRDFVERCFYLFFFLLPPPTL
jgi:hypothetical protein